VNDIEEFIVAHETTTSAIFRYSCANDERFDRRFTSLGTKSTSTLEDTPLARFFQGFANPQYSKNKNLARTTSS